MNAQLSVAEIVKRAATLEKKEFENLFKKLSALRLQKNGIPFLNESESELLSQINKEFSLEKLERLKYLDWKLEFGSLSQQEEAESLKLAEAIENYSVERLKNLSQLALLRKISVDELIEQLGTQPQVNG